jgi:ParB/RepB/Spo0J family partition protein
MKQPRFRYTTETVPLDKIDRDPNQPREKFDEERLTELAHSIEQEGGLVQLPLLKPNPARPGHFIIVTGERRIRALGIAGFTEHEFTVRTRRDGQPENSSYTASMVENMHREGLNYIEQAKGMKRLREVERKSVEEICRITGVSDYTYYKRLELLELPKEIQQLIIDGKLPPRKALNLANFSRGKKKFLELAHDLIDGVDLTVETAQLEQTRKTRRVRLATPGTPEDLLRRVMDFAWRGPSTTLRMEEFLALDADRRQEVLGKVSHKALANIAEQLWNISVVSRRVVMEIGKANPDLLPAAAKGTVPQNGNGTNGNGAEKTAKSPVHSPITITGTPSYLNQVQRHPAGRVERFCQVIAALVGNPERRGAINLSTSRLQAVTQIANSGLFALQALEVAWASWDTPPGICEGQHKRFLQLIAGMKERYGGTFPEAMNNIWVADKSPDALDLSQLSMKQ